MFQFLANKMWVRALDKAELGQTQSLQARCTEVILEAVKVTMDPHSDKSLWAVVNFNFPRLSRA